MKYKTIKKTSQRRLEKLIRSYRQKIMEVFLTNLDDDKYTSKLIRAKKHLAPTWKEEHDALMTKKLENWLLVN